MAKGTSRGQKRARERTTRGKCYFVWFGRPKSPRGFWVPLECDCTLGCIPHPPNRHGNYKFEVVVAMCVPLSVRPTKVANGPVMNPLCPGLGDCEYVAKKNNGDTYWDPIIKTCEDDQNCFCVAPDWEPDFIGQHAMGACLKR